MLTSPVPQQRPHLRRHHGHEFDDVYAWLADPSDEEVLAHLRAENAYAEAMTAPLEPLRARLFEEIKARTQESDLSVPVAYRGWWYYRRTVQGQQYPIRARVRIVPGEPRPELAESSQGAEASQGPESSPGSESGGVEAASAPAGEQILLDGNVEAGDSEFFSVGACEVSYDGTRLAYALDLRGDERFALRIRDIATGEILDDTVRDIGYGVVWSRDGRYVFYTRVDEAWRPHEVWRHEVGTDVGADVRVFAEPDERFWLGITSSRDERWLVVMAGSRTTSEHRLLDLADPTGPLRVVAARREGVEYDVEPCGDILLVVHNTTRPDFEIAWTPLTPTGPLDDPAHWREWLSLGEGERVTSVDAFASHVVVSLRSGGLTALRVVPLRDSQPHATPPHATPPAPQGVGGLGTHGTPFDVPVEEELYTVSLGDNPEWESQTIRYSLESLVTPGCVAQFDLRTGRSEILKRQPVRGGYDPADYRQQRAWARADDGTLVPMSIVARADTPLDGSAPGLLYAYGAYEICLDPWFSIARLGLLDRGLVVAIAHVRGGGEMGRSWYEQGRLEHKVNTFTDTLACARHLREAGLVDPARLGLEGGSAGGLLVGAVLNLDPSAFRVALAQVPFVDALTTILDPSLPLTVIEWDEWGDPLHDPSAYARMARYTPYENVQATQYPAILATTSLNDTRVSYAEPAKWIARLRETVTNDPVQRPILLRTEMSAGHGGRSGRYDAWHQYAWEMAFVLDQLGAADVDPSAGQVTVGGVAADRETPGGTA